MPKYQQLSSRHPCITIERITLDPIKIKDNVHNNTRLKSFAATEMCDK